MAFNYAIFASGSGSNALALIQMGKSLGQAPSFIIVNNKNAGVIDKANQEGIKVILIETTNPKVEVDFELELVKICREHKIKWVFLAGFMKILGKTFLEAFSNDSFYRVINIHPSLLPLYKGLNAYEKAFTAGDLVYGFTVHLVDEKIDHGQIIYQYEILSQEKDNLNDFKNRGLELENIYYPQILKMAISDEVEFVNCILNEKRCLKGESHEQ